MRTTHHRHRDRGSVLPMVLLFVVIGSLIVVPLLSYASTVLKVNTVSVEKTEGLEIVRGGARVAVADPADLFVRCTGGTTVVPIPAAVTPTSTTCREVARVAVLDELEVPFGAAAIQLGETVPAEVSYSRTDPGASTSTSWWGDPTDTTSCIPGTWCPDPKQDTIWLPPLPESETSIQEATGYPLPAPQDCTIYFPGTYQDEVVIDGPSYFVSGVYTFFDDLTVVGGADAVVGFGLAEGCVDNDVAAVLNMYPNPLPPTLNAEGNGATLIFGDEARLLIDDTVTTDLAGDLVPNSANLPVRFEINQRYIQDVSDTAARVSILSINGDMDIVDPLAVPPTTVTGDLDVPDALYMPESVVKTSTGTFELISNRGLTPSSLTPEPRAPEKPTITDVQELHYDPHTPDTGALRVEWAVPLGNDEGGSTITKYVVTAEPTATGLEESCQTDGALECVIRGMKIDREYEVTIVAANALGDSEPSDPFLATPRDASPHLQDPQQPANVSVTDPTTYLDEAEISWDPPFDTGNAPIVGYRVEAYRAYNDDALSVEIVEPTPFGQCETWSFRDQPAATTCVVSGLPPLDTTTGAGPAALTSWLGYRFTVTAITAESNEGLPVTPLPPASIVGEATSAPTDPPIADFNGTTTFVDTAPYPPVWPVAPTYVPDPIVEVNLTGSPGSSVTVAGYMAIPQGRLRVHNPTGQKVDLVGGVVAGAFDVDAATLATMDDPYDPTNVGFENVVLQRTVELRTTAPGERVSSTMRVQINANGADISVNSWVIQ